MLQKIYGFIKKGKFIPDRIEIWRSVLQKFEGKRVFCTFQTDKKNRSLKQNAYYWGVIIKMLSLESGYTETEIHDILKYEYLRIGLEKNGKRFTGVRSTTDLNTVEFNDYIEKCIVFGSVNYGLIIPLPNEIL